MFIGIGQVEIALTPWSVAGSSFRLQTEGEDPLVEGIDIGDVELVCQIGSPRSIGLLLQRIGRSGHTVGGTPKGRLFPLTRDELVECAALARGIAHGNLDALKIPPWPLDILGQQMVAACAAEDWGEDALFELCRFLASTALFQVRVPRGGMRVVLFAHNVGASR